MPARLFPRTKKIKLSFPLAPKTLLLSAIFLLAFFIKSALVFAQTPPPSPLVTQISQTNADRASGTGRSIYSVFDTLFDISPTIKARLNFAPNSWTILEPNVTDLTFVFDGGFQLDRTGDFGSQNLTFKKASDYWNMIANFNSDRHVFLLRLCDVDKATGKPVVDSVGKEKEGDPGCIYADWPYAQEAEKPTFSANNSTIQQVQDAINLILTKKIFHHGWKAISSTTGGTQYSPSTSTVTDVSKTELTNFSVAHKPGSFTSYDRKGSFNKKITAGNKYQVDLWYCAGGNNGPNPTGLDVSNGQAGDLERYIKLTETDRMRMWENACDPNENDPKQGHVVFFRMAGMQFTAPTDQAQLDALNTGLAVNLNANTETPPRQDGNQSVLPNCHILDGAGPGEGSFVGCIAWLVYYGIYWPVATFAQIMGYLFDFFLGYSIGDEAYRLQFAVDGWKMIRDISNIFFIVILIWTGFVAVFDLSGNTNMKKVVPTIIINALLINFSLFFTRAVIDISNVTARIFYNLITVTNKETGENIEIAGYKSVSTSIVSAFNPQKIFQPELLTQRGYENAKDGSIDGVDIKESEKQINTNRYATIFIIISVIAAAILFSVAVMFWKTAFFFLGRTVGLYITMIFAPFAFLTRNSVPLIGNIKNISWGYWIKDLSSYATLAPLFAVFLYLIFLFTQSSFVKIFLGDLNGNFAEVVISITIPMLIVYIMIRQGVEIAKTYAGMVGNLVQNTVQGITGGLGAVAGGAVGLAAGAAAFAGRNTVGRLGQIVGNAKTNTLDKDGNRISARALLATKRGWMGRFGNYALNKTTAGSWDARNLATKVGGKQYSLGGTITKGFNLLGKRDGEKMQDRISDDVGLGQKKALGEKGKAGGVIKMDQERAKRRQEKNDEMYMSHLSDTEAKQAWGKYADDMAKKAEDRWENHVDDTKEMKDLKERVEKGEKDLAEAKKKAAEPTATAADIARASTAETELADAKKTSEDTRGLLLTAMKEGRNTVALGEAKKAANEKERERLKKYGNVKDNKTYVGAMRSEYAESLRNDSFWMVNGGKFGLGKNGQRYLYGVAQGAAGVALMAVLPGLGSILGAALLASAVKGLSDQVGEIHHKATGNSIRAVGKSQGRGSKIDQYSRRLEEVDDVIKAALKDRYDKEHTSSDIDAMDTKDIEEALAHHSLSIEDAVHSKEKIAGEPDPEKKRDMRRENKLNNKRIKELEGILKERNRLKSDIDKVNEDQEKKASGAPGGGKPEGKSDDSKAPKP